MNKPAPSRRYRGDQLREQVLATALRLFAERGYFNTSIHDIRREAGVSIGAIYHHFGTKEQLAKALYDQLMARMEEAVNTAASRHAGARERCRAIIAALFDATLADPAMMDFVLMARHREFLPDEAPICSSRPFMLMKQAVEQGIADGEIRDIHPWVAASTVFGGALRLMNLQLDGGLDTPLGELVDAVVDSAWHGVAPSGSSGSHQAEP